MITFLVFIIVLSILIVVHEFGHFIMAKRMGVVVERFSLGFGPKILGLKKKETEYTICAIPLGGYVKLGGDNLDEYTGKTDEYLAQPPSKRFMIIFSGPLFNYILGIICFWLIFFAGYPALTSRVGGLIDGLGAKEAGIVAGDKIIKVENKEVRLWDELQRAIQLENTKAQLNITILRENKEINLKVKIKQEAIEDILGQKHRIGLIGIIPSNEIQKVRHGFIPSFFLGVQKAVDLTNLTYKALWRMITGKLSVRQSVTGLPGIFYLTSKAASMGIISIIYLMAALSISLCLFNLLPFPALDGSYLLLLVMEKITGKYLSPKVERMVTQFGLAFLITLAALVTFNDLFRFYGDKMDKVLKFFKGG
jgi:regulator of sigma E protease